MGNEEVEHTDKYAEIIDGLKSKKFTNISFITGAGISTSAGIPDFRSRGGMFDQVAQKYHFTQPEDLFEINSFYRNPIPFYDFCKGFNIDNCKPSKTHLFMGFLCKKNIVKKIFTQNVDGLELKAGVPENRIVFAHGTITKAACPNCKKEIDINILKNEYVMKDKVMYCDKCKRIPIKPKVVFYGESLPLAFTTSFLNIYFTDLSFIMGTSLAVYPFNTLPYQLPKNCWKVLVNKEKVGDFDFDNKNNKELFIEGYTDEVVEKIVKDVGWENEFNSYCEEKLAALN